MNYSTSTTLDRGEIRRNLDGFAAAWRDIIDDWRASGATHTEKSHAQQYWSDLLRCFGVIPERIKLFERDATRATSGRTGYIDLFWSGVVIGEAKSLGRDLDQASGQAMDYLAGGSIGQHEWPRFAIVSDFENLRVTKLGDDGWTVAFTVDEVADHIDQLMFLAGEETVTKAEEEEASIHASRLMADLYTAMLGDDDADVAVGDEAPTDPEDEDWQVQKTSVFLTRILFLLYGDDAGLWEEDLFYRFVLYDTTGENLGARLNTLFQVLNTPESRRRRVPAELEKFPYVNGSLFAEHAPQEFFDEDMRQALLAACRFHWTRISPAVFGSMFQLVKSREARRADGEHYTTESNILKVIEPLFLDELRGKATRLIGNKSTSAKALREFRDSLAEMVFLDPACGCGNFLVVAYREMRAIETDIIVALRQKEGQSTASMDVSLDQRMNIGQFHGFELNWWPAKIAETAMFLVDHQANRTLAAAAGDAPDRLPIVITAHIRHGNALQLDWKHEVTQTNGATYVFGNPPFRGDARTREQQAELQLAWGAKKQISRMDYVTGWHAKSLALLEERIGSFAFVTTNSITQGDQVPRLFGPIFSAGWRIRFAHRTFAWNSDAPGKAAVHCVIVGFDRAKSPRPQLWEYPSGVGEPVPAEVGTGINGYLVDGPNVLVAKAPKPISSEIATAVNGSKPADGGHFNVSAEELPAVRADSVAVKYLRRFVGARELLHNEERWCLWLRDVTPNDVSASPLIRRHLDGVRAFRAASKNPPTNKLQYQPQRFFFDGSREEPYLCVPSVASSSRRYLTAQRLTPDIITSNLNYTIADPDGFQFAMASSAMFITWQKTVGGRLKSDIRFANTLTWHTFPVPELDEKTRTSIIKAGQGVLEARALYPERSLADAYNPLAMDPALVKAHDKLDRLVDKAFGADRKLTTERQRLEILFARYAEMTSTHASA